MAANYRIKFMFADAVTCEEEFPPQTTVAEAKTKLIGSSWPAGLAATCHPRAARAPLARALLPISEGKRPIVSGRLPCAQAVSLHVLCRLVKSASCVRPCCGLCLVARASAPGAAPFGPKSTNFGAPGRMHLRARGQLQNAVDCPHPSAPSAEV